MAISSGAGWWATTPYASLSRHPSLQNQIASHMERLPIDTDYLQSFLIELLGIPSPTGYTDRIVHRVGAELESLGISFELSRRGAIRAVLRGSHRAPAKAVVGHVDTIGAMVKSLKDTGRLGLVPIGSWSSRFAEGARATIFTDHHGPKRGSILPLKASGHTFNTEVDSQPVDWDHVEMRTDDFCTGVAELESVGFAVGDFVAIDPQPELYDGFIISRHLDNKAGCAAILAAAKAITQRRIELPVDCYLLFTITEEVGTGASAVMVNEVAEMVAVDNATPAQGQNSRERGVTIAMADQSGPFDYHLSRRLLKLCRDFEVEHQRDVFKFYRCDAASAVEAGNDIRVALACFGADASHGYERTHISALKELGVLIGLYMQSEPIFERDKHKLGPLTGFPVQPD